MTRDEARLFDRLLANRRRAADARKVGGDWFAYTQERVLGPFATEHQAQRAQGIEALSDETRSGSAGGESPVPEGNAP